ncbi:hypothetical protein EIN_359400 [Entamoeba invadens IP1]|uniref:Uncharacterized protein n=1 Tax=Entamoeba invadens IP1 TaxID=370355 RepID=A0A0A1U7P2_ENTIV|nr:hypothetical protein EIN_359400 [Entamoeba invadens IP1]ELP90857.1 hypothetical protein EIN_359400 [Entamoeba invadens IP1]|eukprot:XP_004257628.1 hypothetical protein EIN_359400 [Entamoeba invadens IP1]
MAEFNISKKHTDHQEIHDTFMATKFERTSDDSMKSSGSVSDEADNEEIKPTTLDDHESIEPIITIDSVIKTLNAFEDTINALKDPHNDTSTLSPFNQNMVYITASLISCYLPEYESMADKIDEANRTITLKYVVEHTRGFDLFDSVFQEYFTIQYALSIATVWLFCYEMELNDIPPYKTTQSIIAETNRIISAAKVKSKDDEILMDIFCELGDIIGTHFSFVKDCEYEFWPL